MAGGDDLKTNGHRKMICDDGQSDGFYSDDEMVKTGCGLVQISCLGDVGRMDLQQNEVFGLPLAWLCILLGKHVRTLLVAHPNMAI